MSDKPCNHCCVVFPHYNCRSCDPKKEWDAAEAKRVHNLEQEIIEKDAYIKKLEALVLQIHKSCLCDRNTKGFDHHENHPKLGKAVGRWLTPTALIEARIDFDWRYESKKLGCKSWKRLKLRNEFPDNSDGEK